MLTPASNFSDEEVKAHFSTNVIGQLAVTRAVLPYLRKQRSSVVGNMGSLTGWEGGPGCGFYCATKSALVGISEALREEVKHLNIQSRPDRAALLPYQLPQRWVQDHGQAGNRRLETGY